MYCLAVLAEWLSRLLRMLGLGLESRWCPPRLWRSRVPCPSRGALLARGHTAGARVARHGGEEEEEEEEEEKKKKKR